MSISALFFLILLSLCVCQQRPQCPRRGQVRRADPNNNRRFLQCNDGSGRWFMCAEGLVFIEDQQACAAQSRTYSRGNSRREINSNTRDSSRGTNGGVEFDYHW